MSFFNQYTSNGSEDWTIHVREYDWLKNKVKFSGNEITLVSEKKTKMKYFLKHTWFAQKVHRQNSLNIKFTRNFDLHI